MSENKEFVLAALALIEKDHHSLYRECVVYRGGDDSNVAFRGPMWAALVFVAIQNDQLVRRLVCVERGAA